MPRPALRSIGTLAAMGVVLAAITCEGEPPAGGTASPAPPATTEATATGADAAASGAADTDAIGEQQLDFARRPITYFNARCGACHGNYGSYWLEGVLANLSDDELRTVVDEMALGPAQAPLEELALDVQVAYHRSLIDGRPFVSAFRSNSGLAGEVTPGSRVVLITPSGEREARVEGHAWTSDAKDAARVRVATGSLSTELAVHSARSPRGHVLYSHAKPTPSD